MTKTKASPLAARYSDAYSVAGGIVANGDAVKNVGFALAVLIALGVLVLAIKVESAYPLLGLLLAVFVWYVCYWTGLLICAQGQILMALLDSAVNGSPLMSNEVKAEIMGVGEIKMEVLAAPTANASDAELIDLIEGIQATKDKKQIPFLIECLRHNNSDVKWQAADALGEIQDAISLKALKPLLSDPDKYVREHAEKAMNKITGEKTAG